MSSDTTYRELSDKERIDSVLDEVSAKNSSSRGGHETKFTIDYPACELLMHYVDETVSAVLKEASLLASHRNSNILEVDDLQLVLLKKYGLDVPGSIRRKLLHKQVCDSDLNAATSKSILTKLNVALVVASDLNMGKVNNPGNASGGESTQTITTEEMAPVLKRSRQS